MGSYSRLVADAFMTICNNLSQAPSRLDARDMTLSSDLHYFIWILFVTIVFLVYRHVQQDVQPRLTTSPKSDELTVRSLKYLPSEEHLLPPAENDPVLVKAPFYDLAPTVSDTSCPIEEHQLEKSSSDALEEASLSREDLVTSSPLSSPAMSASWPPRLNRSASDSTYTDISLQSSGPLVHVLCTHVEQKIGKNGLVSSITRPSFHVSATHFPQLQTTFAASSERAFFNSQQELSASPIVRDPRCLDLQYRLSPSTNAQALGEVNFDEIIATIRRNRKAGRDTTLYVYVVRVKDIIPSVILNYVYYGQRHRSVVSAMSQFSEDVPQCTKIVDFRAHLVRVKHISPDTLLWDCARHVVKSVKQDHGIILQTRDLAVEIHSQDQGDGDISPFKIDSSEAIRTLIRDVLPKLLPKNGNVVHLQVSVFKKI